MICKKIKIENFNIKVGVILLTLIFIFPIFAFASVSNGTVSVTNYSSSLLDNTNGLWASSTPNTEKIFWNTQSPYEVQITDSELSGYIWGPGVGWISLNCKNTSSCRISDFKVTNDGNGNLAGYGWGENTGWVNFSCANPETNNCNTNGNAKVTINSQGQFAGFAWAQNFGWVKFDCENSGTCVETDWRPASSRTSPQSGSLSGGTRRYITTTNTVNTDNFSPGENLPPNNPPQIFPSNTPSVVEPINSKTVSTTENISGLGKVTVSGPSQIFSDKEGKNIIKISIKIEENSSDDKEKYVYVFNITASDLSGAPVHRFKDKIKIELPIPENLKKNPNLKVLTKENIKDDWKVVENVTFNSGVASFYVDHLSYFALVAETNSEKQSKSNFLSIFLIPLFFIIAVCVIIYSKKKK